jgi:ABC-2 type transport system permease protein
VKNVINIVKRELYSYFISPLAYVVMGLFLLITGWFFSSTLFLIGEASLERFFGPLQVIFLFFIPAITMRLIAEERKNGMFEQILTMPITDVEYIIGKFLSALLFLLIALSFTSFYWITISVLGNPDHGVIITGYLSALFLGALHIAIGIFASSLSLDQVVAFIIAFFISFVLYLADKVVMLLPVWLQKVVYFLGTGPHYNNMLRGVIDSRDVLYFLTMIIFFLFLALRRLDQRKW